MITRMLKKDQHKDELIKSPHLLTICASDWRLVKCSVVVFARRHSFIHAHSVEASGDTWVLHLLYGFSTHKDVQLLPSDVHTTHKTITRGLICCKQMNLFLSMVSQDRLCLKCVDIKLSQICGSIN